MMHRLVLVMAIGLGLVGALPIAEAQPPGRMHEVGYLTLASDPRQRGFWRQFMEAMRDLNYVEGRNLIMRVAFADGREDRLPGLAADLVLAKVDVIVLSSTQETRVAKQATSTIPIVMVVPPDPVEQGLVASLARPGGNVTGLTSMAPGASQKLVELLRETVPSASRVAVLSAATSPSLEIRRELQAAAHQTGITLAYVEIKGADDLDSAVARAKKDGAAGIIAPFGHFTYTHRARLAQLLLKHRLPAIYWNRDYVDAGGLMSYGASMSDTGRRVAYFVDRILKGAKPADLPVEQPVKFELVINLKTAKTLGLTVPPALLLRADQVLE